MIIPNVGEDALKLGCQWEYKIIILENNLSASYKDIHLQYNQKLYSWAYPRKMKYLHTKIYK